jgi:SAM-dependent methyltransferase
MTKSNDTQREYWNGPTGERWAARQEIVDRTLSNIGGALMTFAAPRGGMRVLDIGCGAGTTTLALAKAVAPGAVTGVDISAPMLAAARSRHAGPSVEFIEADASLYNFAPEFDLAFSRFGVMFFADPLAAFTHIKTALKPGGRLAFVCWRAFEENAWAFAPYAAALDLLPPQEPPVPHAPGPFGLADRERLKSILVQSGFRNVRVERFDTVMNMGATVEEAAGEALNIGPLAHASRDLDEILREKIRERAGQALAKFKTPAGIAPPASCWLVGASA